MDRASQHSGGPRRDRGGGSSHHRAMARDFRRRFLVAAVLTVPILALAPIVQKLLGVKWSFPGSRTSGSRWPA